jgi:hypothetical protein
MITLILILAWIISEAYRDGTDILKGNYITDHRSRTLNRVTVGCLIALIDPIYGLMTLLIFWGIFDTTLNIVRGLKWNYMGSTANTDKLGKKYPSIYWGSKAISLIIPIILMLSQVVIS